MDIRGYGPVKEAAIHQVKAEVERLWTRIAERPAATDADAPAALSA
jgi:indolepyruvate ferredoxin oxidoreductase